MNAARDRSATWEMVVSRGRSGSVVFVVIRDVGLWDRQLTITNDAEGVVERLAKAHKIGRGTRLFYYDSEGELDELKVEWVERETEYGTVYDARFAGFRHCSVDHHYELGEYLAREAAGKEGAE